MRSLYITLGLVSLTLGAIGIFLPLMPTTVFVLLAGFFFARSSERLNAWLMSNRRFGPMIRDYQAGLGISMRSKLYATAAIAVTFGTTMALAVRSAGGRLILMATAAGILWFILSRPTRQPASGEAG